MRTLEVTRTIVLAVVTCGGFGCTGGMSPGDGGGDASPGDTAQGDAMNSGDSHPGDATATDTAVPDGARDVVMAKDVPNTSDVPGSDGSSHDATGSDATGGDATNSDVTTGGDATNGDVTTSGDATNGDATTGGDATNGDASTGGDAMAGSDVTADAGYDPCAAIVNLNNAGTLTGSTTDYNGSTLNTPAGAPIPGVCTSNVGYEQVLQYTARTNAVLNVSLVNAGTPTTFDTVLWVLNTCAASGTSSLGCDDDSTDRRSMLTTSPVTAGETVFIVVAGYTPPAGAYLAQSTYEITVREVTTVPTGGTCDPSGATNVCVTGDSCATAGTTSTCVVNGSLGGQCLQTTPACNAGLACSSNSTCVPTIPTGSTCDPSLATNVCVTGASCITSGANSTCVTDGTQGGACLGTTPECNTGLGCNTQQTCVPSIPVGGSCDPNRTTNVCVAGASCIASGTTSTCIGDGTQGGACLGTSPPCDTGLGCNTQQTCVPAIPAGGSCDPTGVANVCVSGAGCSTSAGASTCVALATYVESSIATPTWIDACATGTRVAFPSSRDDGNPATAVTIPFTFQLFGTPYTQLWPDTNGFLSLGPTAPNTLYIGAIPNSGEGALVAPFWEDLVLAPSPTADVCYLAAGTEPNQAFVVEWFNADSYEDTSASLTFEAVLHEDGSIDFVYETMNPNTGSMMYTDGSYASCAIGLQSPMGASTVVHSGTVAAMTGLHYTPM